MTKLGEEYETKKTSKKNKALNEKLAHKGILKNSTRIDKENQKIVLLEFLNKMCVTLKIYLEWDKANLKFEI